MDLSIFLILVQDGLINGSIYALLALSLVLLFTVTRVIFIPQGDMVAYGALTLAALEARQFPLTVWMLVVLGASAAVITLWQDRQTITRKAVLRLLAETLLVPCMVLAVALWAAPRKLGLIPEMLLALAIVTPMGPYLYRVLYRPLADASVLVLLIAALANHLTMVGLGLVFFGAEGSRTSGFTAASFSIGPVLVTGQALWIMGTSLSLMIALYLFFERTIIGKALRATAVNRLGARLVGIEPAFSGRLAFGLAAFIGALSGMLIAPVTTIYYDTGFLIGLKGFVAAIIAGLASYPLAAAAALLVGIIESFASFEVSAFKEVVVFMVIIPVLLWRSIRSPHIEDEE